ncbi:unnamed protein product [Prorocentrum cordatum]|uniref:Solute carrier family 40 protein n=1 Tax=Prorocentrum cordatum TaxID=2364126 RepID=A0ABN9Y197_9DINO|nr:unnamed protein product [Polarella glacialis]
MKFPVFVLFFALSICSARYVVNWFWDGLVVSLLTARAETNTYAPWTSLSMLLATFSSSSRNMGLSFTSGALTVPRSPRCQLSMTAFWFSIGELESILQYGHGDRQGCKVGAAIYNAACDIPLQFARQWLERAGVAIDCVLHRTCFFQKKLRGGCGVSRCLQGSPPRQELTFRILMASALAPWLLLLRDCVLP